MQTENGGSQAREKKKTERKRKSRVSMCGANTRSEEEEGGCQKRSERIKGFASARLRLDYLPTRIKAKENMFLVLQFWLNYYEVHMDLILLKFII